MTELKKLKTIEKIKFEFECRNDTIDGLYVYPSEKDKNYTVITPEMMEYFGKTIEVEMSGYEGKHYFKDKNNCIWYICDSWFEDEAIYNLMKEFNKIVL